MIWPLSLLIANFFMEGFEKKAIEQATRKAVCWFRYVDDNFVIWHQGQEKLLTMMTLLNYRTQNSSLLKPVTSIDSSGSHITKIFIQCIKWMKIQEIFQGTFKLISIMAQFFYLRRQTVEHPNPSVICSLLIYWQIRYWQM